MPILGYLITFRTYGTWLHGTARGSVDSAHATPGSPLVAEDPAREVWERALLKQPPFDLNAECRFVVDATINEVCQHRGWTLHALNVRTSHVHAVVSASHAPERVMSDFKAHATRRLRETSLLDPVLTPWAHHGSTRYLHTPDSLLRAVHYVQLEQGPPLEMRAPSGTKASRANEPRA